MALVAIGRSYRLIGREVGLSKNTVVDIVKRHRGQYGSDRVTATLHLVT
jgi:putative DNA-invertase from lambdoid prophage Rac